MERSAASNPSYAPVLLGRSALAMRESCRNRLAIRALGLQILDCTIQQPHDLRKATAIAGALRSYGQTVTSHQSCNESFSEGMQIDGPPQIGIAR